MVLAIDYGEKRCGYAVGESLVSRSGVISEDELMDFVERSGADTVVFGLPLSMSGRYSCQTFKVIGVAEKVKRVLNVDVRFVDERLSTRMAHEILKKTRGNTPVDAVSASLILENFLKNPENSFRILDRIPKITVEPVKGEYVLIHQVPDPGILDIVDAGRMDVLQRDPYIAYIFKKRVRFVERFEEYLKGGYDVVVTSQPNPSLDSLLSEEGEIIIATMVGEELTPWI